MPASLLESAMRDPELAAAMKATAERRHPSLSDSIILKRSPQMEDTQRISVLPDDFHPTEPRTLKETRIPQSQLEAIVLRMLLHRGTATGSDVTRQLCLPLQLANDLLVELKSQNLLGYTGSSGSVDFRYQLTNTGVEQAQRRSLKCSYYGAAPVAFSDYLASVKAQSLRRCKLTMRQLQEALAELELAPEMLAKIGQSISSAKSIFLYGAPGNGKTSIAERVTAAFGKMIWIPRAVNCDGEVIRLFDPLVHQECPPEAGGNVGAYDQRWIRVTRPTIVVGGELTLDRLELIANAATGVLEAPVQMKSNCGTLVIDDFGRQRMRPDELLNRWIVPLDRQYDMLGLPNGKRIQVPFEQMLVFSTNLNPRALVDEAFLRRIPYKIPVSDPSETQFRTLFQKTAARMSVACEPAILDDLIDRHYRRAGRPFRFCHPRDLLAQVRDRCAFEGISASVNRERLDDAVTNYFPDLDSDAGYSPTVTR